jgi:hypothetical protein
VSQPSQRDRLLGELEAWYAANIRPEAEFITLGKHSVYRLPFPEEVHGILYSVQRDGSVTELTRDPQPSVYHHDSIEDLTGGTFYV